jgi:hypothetical protein
MGDSNNEPDLVLFWFALVFGVCIGALPMAIYMRDVSCLG